MGVGINYARMNVGEYVIFVPYLEVIWYVLIPVCYSILSSFCIS